MDKIYQNNKGAAVKVFNKKSGKKYDDRAKTKIITYFDINNIKWEEIDDKFGPDLIAFNPEKFYVEVEIKNAWGKVAFPYDTVDFTYRRGMKKEKYQDAPTIIYMFNATCNHLLSISQDKLLSVAKLKPKKCFNTGYRFEDFWTVPLGEMSVVL